jgi:NADH:ubiquinone reductase (H+-translocating)
MASLNVPKTGKKRVLILGAGFAGLTLALKLRNKGLQIVLIDRNNYHQFQPLFYQVAMSGLEPSSILFPLRKSFQKSKDVHIRVAEVIGIEPANQTVQTDIGEINYDHLVICTGADTNYFGNEQLKKNVIPMKSVAEALYLRNAILGDYEKAVTLTDLTEREDLLDVCIVGGGPTGLELAGSLAEMRNHIIKKDYPELDPSLVDITLVQGADRLLDNMSLVSSEAAKNYLEKLGVKVVFLKYVKDYDGKTLTMSDGTTMLARKVIWAAGINGQPPAGLPKEAIGPGNRILIDSMMQVVGQPNVYSLGDTALQLGMTDWPKGHPQVAQVAIQMANQLAKNLTSNTPKPFKYKDLGSMATIGRNKAVVDLPFIRFKGFFAWIVWMFIHLASLIGARNKVVVFINWFVSYMTYDQSLRLWIKPRTTNAANPIEAKEQTLM